MIVKVNSTDEYIELLKQAYAECSEADQRLAEEFMAISAEAEEVEKVMANECRTWTST